MTATSNGYPPEKLIFLLGIMPRSGTNYLFDLLLAHRDCTASNVPEDFFLNYSDRLENFVGSILADVDPGWGVDAARLYGGLRRGLVSVLANPEEQRRVIAKTPSVNNLHLFFKLFPNSQVVILVRDGRAVVESSRRSFKQWDFDGHTRRWAIGAQSIVKFKEAQRDKQHLFTMVRYEDLYTRQTEELKRLYDFLHLNTDGFDFKAVENIPVRGSSSLGNAGDHKLNWVPVAKTQDFNPLERFKDWTPAQHARFNWLAGDALRLLGYEPWPDKGSSLVWQGFNRWRDAQQSLQRVRPFLMRQVRRLSRRQRR